MQVNEHGECLLYERPWKFKNEKVMFSAFKGLLIQGKRCNKRDQMWDDEKALEMGSGGTTHKYK